MTIAAADSVSPQEGYAHWAATYDKDINPVVALQERILRATLPDARSKTVVDLGCGTGRSLSLWREQKPARLIGIDFSPPMLRRAASSADSLIAADCSALPLGDGIADLVSCCLTLGYLSDIDSFASEVARITSPGGAILISELHPESVVRFGWRRGYTRAGRAVNIESRAFPIQEIKKGFEKHGLEAELLLEVPFGSDELPLFESAGKRERFEAFRQHPAIYILQLRRDDSPTKASVPITLSGAQIALNATEIASADVTLDERTICSVGIRPKAKQTRLDLSGYLLLPGLINAHDHLEFALFPRLGHGPYQNSREWAGEIYRPEESPIREHLEVPKWVRLWWGAIRNLLCGVTTVCHHNPYDAGVFGEDFPVRVVRDFAWAHSLAFDSSIISKFRESDRDIPFMIHAAEGVDRASADEIHTLATLGMLDKRTVIVHGTALDTDGLDLVRNSGAALVWCPSSNVFLFNRTLAPNEIESLPSKALGSDSPLTAEGDLLDEVRFAAAFGASSQMLFQLVTRQANQVLQLKQGQGRMAPGVVADLVAVRNRGLSPADTLTSLSYKDVDLVIKDGRVCLLSDALKPALPEKLTVGLESLKIDGLRRWVRASIHQLLRLSREALGPEVTMCGRSLTQ